MGADPFGEFSRRIDMVLKRQLPEFGVEIECNGETLRILDKHGGVIEEREVDAPTYFDMSGEVSKVENELIEAASAMEMGR